MPEEFIIRHCAPTLAGLKTGNLFSYPASGMFSTARSLSRWNRLLQERGIRFVLLGCRNDRALILAYRVSRLKSALANPEVQSFLSEFGYPCQDVSAAVGFLGSRIASAESFPHEIGVFLGYPLADVKAFIKNKGNNCSCCGCWKAYADGEAAKLVFKKFKKCADIYRKCHANGADLLRLTVTA